MNILVTQGQILSTAALTRRLPLRSLRANSPVVNPCHLVRACHLVLISDLFEGGDREQMFARATELAASGVDRIVLLALSDDGRPAYDDRAAQHFASLGGPVFACAPGRFPELMAVARATSTPGRGERYRAGAGDVSMVVRRGHRSETTQIDRTDPEADAR